jgi:hypothetical protein
MPREQFRQYGTAFSSVTIEELSLVRSQRRREDLGFTCMTIVTDDNGYKSAEFCLLEYALNFRPAR